MYVLKVHSHKFDRMRLRNLRYMIIQCNDFNGLWFDINTTVWSGRWLKNNRPIHTDGTWYE